MASPAQASETGSTAAVAVAAGHAARCRTSQTVAMPGSRTWDQQPATFDELDVLHAAVTLPRVTATFDSIRTERLLMRRWRDSDRGPFAAMNADPEVMHFFPEPLDRAASDAYLDRIEALFQRQGFGLWALEQVTTGRFLGFTGLNPMPPGVPGAGGMEVGWRLARHAWHQGFATEAATAALDVAFRGVGLAEVWSMTAVLNEPSQAVMRRLGMKLHGHFEHPRVEPGHPLRPHVAYRITRPATV